ncbi:co-chaperone GroES [Staphylococcus aureus]|uniref:co-chaperone GroES n=1 Tax=Staphylococcus aureus TaxID=1280 RepID=UPI0006406CB8|nr:co-chaperone GroES [Staphylococcus aureus]PNN81545.1 co-chaperone GroES [Staphylococcus aureus]
MLKPIGNRVIIEKKEQEQTTKSVCLTDSAKEKSNEGVIVAVGTGRLLNDGTRVTPEVKKGPCRVPTISVQKLNEINETYLVLNEEDILAVIE